MKITYPYEIEINTPEEAVAYIKSGCNNCPRHVSNWECSGAIAAKCKHSANLVAAEFGKKWIYETGKEDYDVTNGHSSYYNIFTTDDEEKAIAVAKEKHNDFLIRKAKIGDDEIEQTYDIKDGWI